MEDLADLGAAAQRLLVVMADPDAWGLTNSDRMARASVSKATYYRLQRDADFVRKSRDALLLGLKGGISGPLTALQLSAQLPGKDGAADRRLLLEMVGLYTPAKKIDHQVTKNPDDLPDEEMVWLWLAGGIPPERWTPGVRMRYEAGKITPRKPEGVPGGVQLPDTAAAAAAAEIGKGGGK